MPHVVIKLYPGRTEEVKKNLADAVAENVSTIAGCNLTAVSVAIEEVIPEDWAEEVYRPDIIEKSNTIVKEPGYNPFE